MYELKMPTECTAANPLQRELADSIIKLSPLVRNSRDEFFKFIFGLFLSCFRLPLLQDDLRILIACGASPNDVVTQGKKDLIDPNTNRKY